MSQTEIENFVTVVSVGADEKPSASIDEISNKDTTTTGYVTVLTIGDKETNCLAKTVTEEVLVYRLPGERLGFGLKFEGGTKASEFVKRLFIQSCAPDSPASRVTSSWGQLTEGDEVLEIDSIPVSTMTRIDCVRCLKDSNVVIKLLVRHNNESNETAVNNKQSETSTTTTTTTKTKSIEDLPLVISAEKKRTPPPPPPVPPRKIPRKLFKHHSFNGKKDLQEDNGPIPPSRYTITSNDINGTKGKKLQSPRSSGHFNSPDIPRRDRRFSDGSLGPPDAEVYVDLFSQESTQSLSESDDTSSTISTVVDRFGSFPTTTTSSFAGSLPSTPTAIQKQLDLTNLLNNYEDDEIVFVKHINQTTTHKVEENNEKNHSDDGPLQPPSCFQDAPLSYGNEDMRIAHEVDLNDKKQTMNCNHNKKYDVIKINNATEDVKLAKKPPVPPRARDNLNHMEMKKDTVHDENMNSISNLPRLVDFVPKSSSTCDNIKENITAENPIEVMKVFLDIERQENHNNVDYDCSDIDNIDVYNNGIDIYSSKWSLTSQLATIGEVEEELSQEYPVNRPSKATTPIVIVENADNESDHKTTIIDVEEQMTKDIEGSMEIPPSGSRLPPDGHEFPDHIETNCKTPPHHQLTDNISIEMHHQTTENNKIHKIYKSFESITLTQTETNSSLDKVPLQKNITNNLSKTSSMSNNDLSANYDEKTHGGDTTDASPIKNLHNRSQSLIDMSALDKQKPDKWTTILEQRKNYHSKLRGLVIPEHTSAIDVDKTPHVNIPLIKSKNSTDFIPVTKLTNLKSEQSEQDTKTSFDLSLPPPWTSNNACPKYSPAFKRKSLQLYSTNIKTEANLKSANNNKPAKPDIEDLRLENLSDPPKSLESITSPTRSDCSFDYVSSTKKPIATNKISHTYTNKSVKDLTRSEDESDNDSALSSSQSSYISRCSPPSSPTNDFEHIYNKNDEDKCNTQCRMLKPSSVEAINRKNILASAKCRSGRDLKVGSPVIQRKYEENEAKEEKSTVTAIVPVQKPIPEEKIIQKDVIMPVEKVVKKENSDCLNGTLNEDNEKGTATLHNSKPKTTSTIPTKLRNSETNGRQYAREITRSEYLRYNKDTKPLSVNALKKNFENIANVSSTVPAVKPSQIASPAATVTPSVNKLSKLRGEKTENKVIAEIKKINEVTKKVEEVKIKEKELPVAKEVHIEKAVKSNTVVLSLESEDCNLGITLVGGSDYENKDITIHRIRYGSIAYQDGRLKRGDKIVSVNDQCTKGMTLADAVKLLKPPITKYVIVIEEECNTNVPSNSRRKSSLLSNPETIKSPAVKVCEKKATNVVSLLKDSGGLGFSIEGGKDSPQGDVPLLIKKIFQGGAADKCGLLLVGDELVAINDISFTNLSRIEAWNLMKKIPEGTVNIHIYR